MSKYTTELRYIVEQAEKDAHGTYTPGSYSTASYGVLGLDSYPLFDESYRSHLNEKIIDHFYFREIGFETAAHFAWQMRRTMAEIMPYFNPLYEEIKDVKLKPFTEIDMHYDDLFGETKDTTRSYEDNHNIDATKDNTRTDNLTSTRTDNLKESGTNASASTTNSQNIYQDTPMSILPDQSVKNLDYATNVTYDDSDDSSNSTYTVDNTGTQSTKDTGTQTNITIDKAENSDYGNSKEEWAHGGGNEHHEYGRRHSQAWLFKEFKDAMINIDLEVIKQLETLFMGVW